MRRVYGIKNPSNPNSIIFLVGISRVYKLNGISYVKGALLIRLTSAEEWCGLYIIQYVVMLEVVTRNPFSTKYRKY